MGLRLAFARLAVDCAAGDVVRVYDGDFPRALIDSTNRRVYADDDDDAEGDDDPTAEVAAALEAALLFEVGGAHNTVHTRRAKTRKRPIVGRLLASESHPRRHARAAAARAAVMSAHNTTHTRRAETRIRIVGQSLASESHQPLRHVRAAAARGAVLGRDALVASSRVWTRLGLTGLWPLASHVTAAAVVLFSFPFFESCGADGVPPSEWWRSSGAALTVVLDAGNASTIEELGDANVYAAEGRAPPLRATRAGGVEFAYFADGAQ